MSTCRVSNEIRMGTQAPTTTTAAPSNRRFRGFVPPSLQAGISFTESVSGSGGGLIMDQDDIAKLVEVLKRTNVGEVEQVVLDKETIQEESDRMHLCLVAKIFSNKPIPRETFKQQMPRILQTSKAVEVESVGENIFILEFRSITDRRRALMEGPWNLFRNLVLFQEIQGLQHPRDITFDKIDIWVQLHNLPLAFMNKKVIESIGGKVGKLVEVDEGDGGNYWGKFARIRVTLEMDKPLKKCISVKVEDAEEILVILVYERLPDFCYACGCIGHVVKDCTREGVDKDDLTFGPCLKAASYSGSKKIKEEGRVHARISSSDSSTSMRANPWSKKEERGIRAETQVGETNAHKGCIETEEVMSNGEIPGQIQNSTPPVIPIVGKYGSKKGDQELIAKMDFSLDPESVQLGDLKEMGKELMRHGTLTNENEEVMETSSEIAVSTGRSPKKWKKMARMGKHKNQSKKIEAEGNDRVKRKSTGLFEMEESPTNKIQKVTDHPMEKMEYEQTAEVATQPRRQQ
ncbi:hypothetical protein DH2020_046431 [Rehmannia glutinosa]|uniref:CCHC-type domain-containing protein n=1 Tax=Rehmannia glutinosa TaxID=99300 RepID=A0ABR0UBZ2_REHGL